MSSLQVVNSGTLWHVVVTYTDASVENIYAESVPKNKAIGFLEEEIYFISPLRARQEDNPDGDFLFNVEDGEVLVPRDQVRLITASIYNE